MPALAGRSAILRAGSVAGLALFAFLALASGIDRVAETRPDLDMFVPPPFASAAYRSEAGLALNANDPAAALTAAERAMRSDPFDHRSAGLLGAARLISGDGEGAQAAFRYAAGLGWRDRLTQAYWYDAALQSADFDQAALRADALLRQSPALSGANDLLAPLEREGASRTALIRHLGNRPEWLTAYLTPPADIPDDSLSRRADVISEFSNMAGPLGCRETAPLVRQLLRRSLRAGAENLWQAHCPDGLTQGPLADTGFEQFAAGDLSSPFGWERHFSGDLQLSFPSDGKDGHVLAVVSQASVTRLIVSQPVDLSPGRYRVSGEISRTGEPLSGRILASIACDNNLDRPSADQGDLGRGGQLLTVIPGCAGQRFALWIRPVLGPVAIDNVEIAPAD